MALLRRSFRRAARHLATPVAAILLLCALTSGCRSAAAHYEQRAQEVGSITARQTRSYIEMDPSLLDRPDDRSRSLQLVDWLERVTTHADVSRFAAIEQAWASVSPLFRTYVREDPALDPVQKQAFLAMVTRFDQLNRIEKGRQSAWFRLQGMQHRLEPN